MAKVPLLLYLSAASNILPVAAGAARPRHLRGPRLFVVLWCLLLIAANIVAWFFRVRSYNTHPITYVIIPFQGSAILLALSLWQTRPMARLTMRAAILPFVVAWLLLVLLVEDIWNFSHVAEPVYSLLALGAALFTLLSRSGEDHENLLRQDWFWICVGLALHFGALAVLTPLGAAFMRTDPQLVIRAYLVRAVINVSAFIVIAYGLLCPPSIRSGPFSSLPSSV